MPTVESYVKQWKHNRSCIASIEREFRDWQITATFYTALHAVNAALAHLGVHVSDHDERNEKVKNNAAFAPILEKYLDLYRISRVTRYDAEPDDWLPEEYLQVSDLVKDLLIPIENEMKTLIGKKAPALSPISVKS